MLPQHSGKLVCLIGNVTEVSGSFFSRFERVLQTWMITSLKFCHMVKMCLKVYFVFCYIEMLGFVDLFLRKR